MTASKILGFAKDRKTGEAYIGIDGKMDKWLIEKGVKEKDIAHLTPAMNEQIPALVGKVCICQRNSKGFLELA